MSKNIIEKGYDLVRMKMIMHHARINKNNYKLTNIFL